MFSGDQSDICILSKTFNVCKAFHYRLTGVYPQRKHTNITPKKVQQKASKHDLKEKLESEHIVHWNPIDAVWIGLRCCEKKLNPAIKSCGALICLPWFFIWLLFLICFLSRRWLNFILNYFSLSYCLAHCRGQRIETARFVEGKSIPGIWTTSIAYSMALSIDSGR